MRALPGPLALSFYQSHHLGYTYSSIPVIPHVLWFWMVGLTNLNPAGPPDPLPVSRKFGSYHMIRYSALRSSLWLSLLLVAVAGSGLAQNQSNPPSLNGVVQDSAGAVVAGARVDLFSGDTKQQSTTTDESGSFKFGKIPAVPSWVVSMGARLMGTEPQLIMTGRRCVPRRFAEAGFSFRFPHLEVALSDLLA